MCSEELDYWSRITGTGGFFQRLFGRAERWPSLDRLPYQSHALLLPLREILKLCLKQSTNLPRPKLHRGTRPGALRGREISPSWSEES